MDVYNHSTLQVKNLLPPTSCNIEKKLTPNPLQRQKYLVFLMHERSSLEGLMCSVRFFCALYIIAVTTVILHVFFQRLL